MKAGMTIQEMVAEVKRRAEAKVDFTVRTNQLRFVTEAIEREIEEALAARAQLVAASLAGPQTLALGGDPNHVVLRDWWTHRGIHPGNGHSALSTELVRPTMPATLVVPLKDGPVPLVINDLAHGQLANHLGIPKTYYDRLKAEHPRLLAENVNTLLQAAPASEYRLVRSLDGVARAFLSDAYNVLDNWDLMRYLMPLFAPTPTQLRDGTFIKPLTNPDGSPITVEFASCSITDQSLYVKIVTPYIKGMVRGAYSRDDLGTVVRAGVLIKNSEVGMGSIAVLPMYEVLACTNLATMEHMGTQKRHVGRRTGPGNGEGNDASRFFSDATKRQQDKAFFMAMSDVVRGTLTEATFQRMLAPMNEAANYPIEGHLEGAVAHVGRTFDLYESEQDAVMEHFIQSGDLSMWGLSNAVTRAAADVESYDRATELEAIGGNIITLDRSEWKVIAHAERPGKKRSRRASSGNASN